MLGIITVSIVFIRKAQIMRLKNMKDYAINMISVMVMPEEGKNILKYRPGEKSLKAPFAIYADLECLLIKEQSCQNNPEKSYIERKVKHVPSGYSLRLICTFDVTKSRHYLYRGNDFCKKLKDLGTEIINYPEKEMIPLTDKEIKSYKGQKVCYICKERFCTDKDNEKEFKLKKKSEIIVILMENLEELLIVFAT